jgi:thiamine biosynthesis lipoprotein
MISRVAYGTFPTMSTTVGMAGVGVSELAMAQGTARARQLAEAWEQRFSRFRPDSLLSRLNAAGGQPIPADDTFRSLLACASLAVQRTGGRFDPSILPALEALGYDCSIDQVRAGASRFRPVPVSDASSIAGTDGWAHVRIDHEAGVIALPAGMRIDLGGIAKGAFVDLLATEFAHWPGGSIDAGGDAVVWGEAPDGQAWHIGVEDPHAPDRDALILDVPAGAQGAIATSGTHRRRWHAGGHEVHHLIDPRTGNPASSGLLSVTALAETVTAAEVATKALLIAAVTPPIIELFGASAAVLIADDGHVRLLHETRGTDHDIDHLTAAGRAA